MSFANIADYVLVYSSKEESAKSRRCRRLFEAAMQAEDLILSKEVTAEEDLIFVKVYAPFKRLATEAERLKIEMPLKGLAIPEPEPMCCGGLINLMKTDSDADFVSAPFETAKAHLFEGVEDETTFFDTANRSLLVYNILTNIDIDENLRSEDSQNSQGNVGLSDDRVVQRRGLLYLLMKRVYLDSFVPHDESADDPVLNDLKQESLEDYYKQMPKVKQDCRHDLNVTWTKFYKFQPLWKIRNYFGEKIAFYFAWAGTLAYMLWLPALIGLGVFFYGLKIRVTTLATDVLAVIKEAFDNVGTPFFSMIICLWGCLFLEVWKRKQISYAYEWDVDTFEQAESDRPEFFGTRIKPDPVTSELLWIYPLSRRIWKFVLSTAVVVLMISLVFVSVSAVIAYKVYIRVKYDCPISSDGNDNSTYTGSPLLCFSLITVIPPCANAFSMLILGKIFETIAYKLTMWENHRTQSEHNDSLILKLFAFHFANSYTSLFYLAFIRPEDHGFQDNGVFHMGPEYKDTCQRGSCMATVSFQVLILMIIKPMPKFFKDIVFPVMKRFLWKLRRNFKRNRAKISPDRPGSASSISSDAPVALRESFLEREYHKPRLGDFTLSEFNEKVLEFGFLLLFSAAFPLAPLIALIVLLVDLRVDAKRLLWFNRRPVAYLASDIGMWYGILRCLVYLGVVTNAFLIAYTSSFVEDFLKLHYDADLVVTAKHRLMVVVVFEHILIASIYLINIIVPDIPSKVKLAMRKEKYQVSKIMEKGTIMFKGDSSNSNKNGVKRRR